MPKIELIEKVQKENTEKLITALILTIHIQLNSSCSLRDLDNALYTCLLLLCKLNFLLKSLKELQILSVEKL